MSDAIEIAYPKSVDSNGSHPELLPSLRARAATPATSTLGERLAALNQLSDLLLHGKVKINAAGNAFLAGFLRQTNLEELLRRELPSSEALDGFVSVGPRKSIRLQPRGVVCHWIAGNVPLLGAFAWAVSAVMGNVNAIRLSSRQADNISPLLDHLAGCSPAGEEMAQRSMVLVFDRHNAQAHEAMSLAADVRIAWGGKEAIETIRSLPCRWDCDDVAMGPRVSYAVVDPQVATGRIIDRLVTDTVYFDQLACSSPQIVFVKGQQDQPQFVQFVDAFAESFGRQALQIPRHDLDFGETYRIQLDRARVLLEGGDLRRDAHTQWTVAVVRKPVTGVACANRFVQIVPFVQCDEVYPHIAENAQTVVTALQPTEFNEFTESASQRAVCRFPLPGEGNHFETPWDGIPLVSRLCRWVLRSDPR